MKKLIIKISIILIMFIILGFSDLNVNKPHAAGINTNVNTKHSIIESITLVQSSVYNPLNNNYINSALDENGEAYKFYSDQSFLNQWLVLIIDTKGTPDLQDDEVINSYNLDDYQFSTN